MRPDSRGGLSPSVADRQLTTNFAESRGNKTDPVVSLADPFSGRRGKHLTDIAGKRHRRWMNELLVGYARVSTEQQDLTAQRNGLHALGVGDDRIYVDHGLNRHQPRPSRTAVGAGRLQSRRHVGGDQAGPAGAVAA